MTTRSLHDSSPTFASTVAAWLLRASAVLLIIASALLLFVTAYVIGRERSWLSPRAETATEPENVRNERAFFTGTIGTEVVPLPVLKVLPQICPEHFRPLKAKPANWTDQFGFLPSSMVPKSVPIDPQAKDLPLGFTLSHYRPKSGAPSPVLFVGLACATCHTTKINGKLVIGTGNTSLNLFAWIDAFQAALLDDRLTPDAVFQTYEGDTSNPPLSLEERLMIRMWLSGARAKQQEDASKYGDPYGGGQSMDPANVPTGPCRTQPFRTLVRTLLARPGSDMKVYTKVAAIYLEGKDEWGQFDGGIHGLYRRSAAAALAAGATPQNMSLPEIANNIKWASDFISSHPGPTWNEIFPDKPLKSDAVKRGEAVYMQYCNDCHGHPGKGQWEDGKQHGQIVPLEKIGTDPARVTFRYFDELPCALSGYFPKNHPFDFPRKDLRPLCPPDPAQPAEVGFINKRMHAMFTRTPYLHNGSVLTLAELTQLKPRRPVFFRGANEYDAVQLGLNSPDEKSHKAGDQDLYFRFDTTVPGNSNAGHIYPEWTREQIEKDPDKRKSLEDLLEYLKTF